MQDKNKFMLSKSKRILAQKKRNDSKGDADAMSRYSARSRSQSRVVADNNDLDDVFVLDDEEINHFGYVDSMKQQ